MSTPHAQSTRFRRLHDDLREIFGPRLLSIVAYETHFGLDAGGEAVEGAADDHAHALVLVQSLTYPDLAACALKTDDWARDRVGTPLLLTRAEFDRSFDAFPLEFAAIESRHLVVAGTDPFSDRHVQADDVRRACETQAKSHLLHLREGFLEAGGEPAGVAALVAASVRPFHTLLLNLARLDGVHAHNREALVRHAASAFGVPEALLDRVLAIRRAADLDRSDALRVYTGYLDAAERIANAVDTWKAR